MGEGKLDLEEAFCVGCAVISAVMRARGNFSALFVVIIMVSGRFRLMPDCND